MNGLSNDAGVVHALIVIVLTLLLVGCYRPPEKNDAWTGNQYRGPDQETWYFTIDFSRGAHTTARVSAKHMAAFSAEQRYILNDSVVIQFFRSDGSISSHITADTAVVEHNGNSMTARSRVVAASDSGIVLMTQALHWQQSRKTIFTDMFVTIISAYDTLYGTGFEADETLQNWKIQKPQGIAGRGIRFD